MIRPSDQFRGQVDRSFWEYVEKMDDGSMTCTFCGHLFAQHTSISRIKLHLSGVVGRGVKICGQVPQDVQDAARAAIDHDPPEKKLKTIAQQGDALLESENNDVIMNDVENMVRVRTEAVEEEENNSGRLEQPVAGASSFGLVDITMCHAPGRSVEEYMRSLLEDSIDNGTGGVAQPGAEASSSGGLRHNPSETRWSYDVFLSFRGEDTRKTITDHLYSALIQAGIHTFRDDNELPRGEEISPQFLRAIEGSRISVVIFSRNYASSRWCLDELVKIMECRQKTHQVVLPIFYDTDPSDVRKQTGSYAKAVDEHEEHFKGEMEKVNRWREALTQAANLSGWDLHNETNGYEAEFIKRVVSDVACKLGNKTLHVAKHPVGISSKTMVRGWTEPVEEHDVETSGILLQPGAGATSFRIIEDNPSESRGAPLLTGSTKLVGRAFEENRNVIWSWLTDNEVSTIGIYGMGGAGKTTMLKHIYNELLQSSDISHHVYWVTVSRDFNVPKLQNKIAKHIQLSFSNEEEELGQRAAELSRELMKKQRWILILDDLLKSFELDKVGIPASLKGCKLIMTTRSEAVCLQMNSKNNVRVNPLSNQEAWTLFMEVLGHDRSLSPQVEQVARDITKECAGLPLGIKTIAGTMKGVDGMHEWSDALEDLKQSKVPQDRVEEEVFRILRFSYTHLNDEALRQCFLYCGLFPEDFEIRRENLIDYLIDEGVVKRQKSREAEINKGHTMLDRLERACLLERLRGGDYVKMHDLIRDMAIQILEENSRAIVKAGAQLKELPDAKEWSEKLESVSLMHNQIEEICSNHSPRCPKLSTLFLRDNRQLGFIVDSFFKQLYGLKVLDLSRTNIECLPDSVSDLEGLTSLLLTDCWRLSSVPSLKKLRALKKLDLSSAPLKQIPHGMECLSNLRYLRMNGCGENKFPGGILPKLCYLQVFILEEWLFDNGIKKIYAPITVEGKEVGCLRKLESLECHFEDQSNYLEYLKSRDATETLRTYSIVVGQLREDYYEQSRYRHSGTKLVVLGNLNINRDRDFLVIFSNDIQGLICKSIDAGSLGDVLPLKYRLNSCTSMESLVSSSWVCSAPLPQQSPSYNGIFSALKLLSISGCKSMKKLFPPVLLPNLVNLEEIKVDDCEKMEEIIGGTSSDEEGAMGEESNEFKLPKLRSLRLEGLPELKSICSAKLICDSLENIDVRKCNSIEIMVSSSWSCLLNLEEITVVKCEKMEKIIGGTRSDERVMGKESISSEFKLPKLRELNLVDLPELKSICNAKLICDSLEDIAVLHCEKLKRMGICLPLLGNGQPSHPPSLKLIEINPKEWWESTVEWEHPNAKDVLLPFVEFEASTSVLDLLQRRNFNLKRGSSLQTPSTNQADEPQGVSSPPKNLSCLGLGSYSDQLCSPSVKHDVIMDDVQSVVKEKTEPIASMLEQSNAILNKLSGDDGRIQVGVHGLEQGAEEELICLHPEAQSGMENTCAEYIQHVDINDSLEQTRLMESNSGTLVQPRTSASSTKLVGRASEKNVIWSWLMDDKVSIIGIYGMGGSGKTTMLRNIYNELLERHDISHSIYWVNMPQDFRIDTSQDLIAKRLDLNLSSKDDDLCRIVELAKKLMMKQKWILILNDLWNSFDPKKLGIPIPLNGSKFIMTTRSEMVCQQMNCQNSIRVDRLSDEEALTLFMEKLGHDRQLSQEEQQIAKDAARECDGLPLGIVTLAESLKGVDDLHKWKITLKRLKESNFWDMEDQIFKTLRLSYDCLDDSAKQCFVYCALFDESHKIERGELIESFIEEGIIKEMSRPAAFDKGHSILDSLENVCLLERIDDGKAVKMHDLLRDMAIQILDDEYSLDMV